MATQRSGPGRGNAASPKPGPGDDEERAYAEWVRRFVRHMKRRLPDEPPHRIEEVLDQWCVYYLRLSPEEAAEVAAMWWHPLPHAKPH